MSDLENEQSTDWLEALSSDARHFTNVINRVESLGILACEDIKNGNLKGALKRLAEMGEGIRLCKQLLGVQ